MQLKSKKFFDSLPFELKFDAHFAVAPSISTNSINSSKIKTFQDFPPDAIQPGILFVAPIHTLLLLTNFSNFETRKFSKMKHKTPNKYLKKSLVMPSEEKVFKRQVSHAISLLSLKNIYKWKLENSKANIKKNEIKESLSILMFGIWGGKTTNRRERKI